MFDGDSTMFVFSDISVVVILRCLIFSISIHAGASEPRVVVGWGAKWSWLLFGPIGFGIHAEVWDVEVGVHWFDWLGECLWW